jgi:hypothetical protein
MNTTTPRWVDCDTYEHSDGQVYYLVEVLNTMDGYTRWRLSDRPCRTNQSREPRLHGWCGETNNRSVYARGLVRVTAIASDGDRCRIARLTDREQAAFLGAAGYPELSPISLEVAS